MVLKIQEAMLLKVQEGSFLDKIKVNESISIQWLVLPGQFSAHVLSIIVCLLDYHTERWNKFAHDSCSFFLQKIKLTKFLSKGATSNRYSRVQKRTFR